MASLYAKSILIKTMSPMVLSALLTACGEGDVIVDPPGPITNSYPINVPVLADDSFFIGTGLLGEMVKYHPRSGATSKFSDLDDVGADARFGESVDVSNNMIVGVANDNTLNALDINSGDLLWDIALGEIPSSPTIDDPTPPVCVEDICYSMGFSGDLVAVNMLSKGKLWSTDLFPREDNHLKVFPLLVTQERIFAGGYRYSSVYGDVEPKLYVVSRTTGQVGRTLPDGYASMAGDLLLISGAGLRAYDFDTLQLVWYLEMDSVSTPAVVGDVVVIHAANSNVPESEGQRVVGINRLDGTVLWTQNAGTMASFFSPTTDGRLIYTSFGENCSNSPCDSGYPMALNPADGSIEWTNRDVSIKQTRPPIVVAGQLLYDEVSALRDTGAGSAIERGVGTLDSSTGAIKWISLGPHAFYSLTAISNGKAYRTRSEPTFHTDR